jgi:hypothetical protein
MAVAAAATAVTVGSMSVAAAPATVRNVHPDGSVLKPAHWAWVVDRSPASAVLTPAAMDQGNSSGGKNAVMRLGTGAYLVLLAGVGEHVSSGGGNAFVSAMGGSARHCAVSSWDTAGSAPNKNELIWIDCYKAYGQHVDTKFSLNWIEGGAGSGEVGYAWDGDPSTADYTNPYYAFNVHHGTNAIHRIGTGRWSVTFANLGNSHGDVQVSTYGASTSQCRVISWAPSGPNTVAQLACTTTFGTALVDSEFTVGYVQGVGLAGVSGVSAAYLLADQASAAGSYTPAAAYRFSSAGMAPTIAHPASGSYVVTLPGMPAGGAAQVSVYGNAGRTCVIKSIAVTTPQKIRVQCWDNTGNAVDTKFTLAYTN